MSAGLPPAIHVIVSGPDYRHHRTSGTCSCAPVVGHDINTPARLVFIHQRQVEPTQPLRTDRVWEPDGPEPVL